jgi:hypothetical protein
VKRRNFDLVSLVFLCVRQLYQRIYFWVRPNFWTVLLSIPLIAAPAAQAALYYTLCAGLRDPGESLVDLRKTFKSGFFRFFGRSLALSLINLAALALILLSIYFWIGFQDSWLQWVTMIALYFLAMWWLTQPFLYPVLVENPDLSAIKTMRRAVLIALARPFHAMFITMLNTLLSIIGLALLGPVLFVIPALVGLISIQITWHLTGVEIPDLVDRSEYFGRISKSHSPVDRSS